MQTELAEWLGSLSFNTFGTWTFGQRWPDGPSRRAVLHHVGNWIESRDLAPAFVVAERGLSGERRWHSHGLCTLPPSLSRLEGAVRQRHWKNWSTRYGRCELKPLEEQGGARWYVSKYCAKEAHDLTWMLI